MTTQLPQVTRIYQNYSADSTRWQRYQPRPDDIIISTPPKSGTTWTQEIVRQLVFCGQPDSPERDSLALRQVSPWLDHRRFPLDEILSGLEAQQHRRFIKAHLPLDGLPYFPQVKYVVVGRDVRDVAMSMWNHYTEFVDAHFESSRNLPEGFGEPLPPPPADIHAFWHRWISRGSFAWTSEGYPFQSVMHNIQSWWNYRHLPNILFVHYSDLKSDLTGEIRRLADFLSISVAEEWLPAITQAVTLEAMREREDRLDPGLRNVWKEGARSFFHKGTNGRWRDVLSAEEVQMYDAKAAQVLTPDCRAWLERGRVALAGNG